MVKNKLIMVLILGCITIVTISGCSSTENIDKSKSRSNITDGEAKQEYNPMLMLVNNEYWLEEEFIPSNLEEVNIPFSGAASQEERCMEYEAAKSLENLVSVALEDGIELYGISGYRSYELQEHIYNTNVENNGQEYTDDYIAIPGRSEHQIGLAMDLGDYTGDLIQSEPEVSWVKDNAHIYGFILRYPKGKEDLTGYNYESWHIRYVGVEVATEIYNKNITFEEYYEY